MFEPIELEEKRKRAQIWVIVLTVALALGAAVYRWEMGVGLVHSAALSIGIPALLAILLALTPRARTVNGGIVKGITLGMLIAAPLLGEGYLCILMAAPLFYAVGIVIGVAVDTIRARRSTTLSCLALILIPMCLEGTTAELSLNRKETVKASALVSGSASDVEAALEKSPRVATGLPRVLRIGFPRPLEARGDGLHVGALRTIHFAGAEGDPPGDLVMRVTEVRDGYARFDTVSDRSKLTQWIRWESSEVKWQAVDATHTRVEWTIHFERELDPKWYFAPMERVAVWEAARYLIDANARPSEARQ